MGAGSDEMKDRSPDEIRHDMQETRDRMGRNIDVIQYRLEPDRLKSRAKETLRENTVGRVQNFADDATDKAKGVSADMLDTIKKNPVPAALVAVGLGWLFMERRGNQRDQWDRQDRGIYDRNTRYYGMGGSYPEGYQNRQFRGQQRFDSEGRYYTESQPGYQGRSVRDQFSERASNMGDQMSDTASNVKDKVSDTASNVQDKLSQTASNVGDTVSNAAGNVSDTMSNVADQAQYKAQQLADQAQWTARRAKSRFGQMMDENPMLVGAAALAVGLAVGMALPETDKERELMGDTSQQLVEKAKGAASDTMDKVQTVAQKTFETAKDTAQQEAQNQNLTK